MDNHRLHLGRGFNWLGTATVAAKVIDFGTVLVLLRFLTKQQLGEASLVISVGMIIEAFNGLGTADALVQAPEVSRRQLDSLFWYVLGAAVVAAGLTLLAAPRIAALYGLAAIAPFFWLVAAKQPLVAAAIIPLALLNRDLKYRHIAMVNLCATLGAALVRLGLGTAGAGVWAMVAGYAASGGFSLIGALVARPFRPGLQFEHEVLRPLTRFGRRAASANLFEQMFKNIDFLLIGWFYGAPPLAVYRIAFDVAMEPAMAVGTLVNRIALPVFARMPAEPAPRTQILAWSLRRVANLVMPLMVGLMLIAGPLMGLLHDDQGNSYKAAAFPLRILACAALLRVTTQLLPTVMLVSGRPGLAARLSAATFLFLTAGICVVGLVLPAGWGIVAVAGLWLAVYPPVIAWGLRYLRRQWQVRPDQLAGAFTQPVVAGCLMAASVLLLDLVIVDPRLRIGLVLAATGAAYAALFRKPGQ